MRGRNGWRVFATTQAIALPIVADQQRGAVGVDLDTDHWAIDDTEACGNRAHTFR